MSIDVKICGLTTEEAVDAAVEGGARWLGVVFFEKSPRNVDPERAAELLDGVPDTVGKVGLFVDPTDADLGRVLDRVRLDMIQLHGHESPERVEEIRREFALPVMKAIALSTRDDLDIARHYVEVADMLLFDAKAPDDSARPGGNALAFDWDLLDNTHWPLPWMLAGGLDAGNVGQAVLVSGAAAVDVSSGVESAPGQKDPARISEFLAAARRFKKPVEA